MDHMTHSPAFFRPHGALAVAAASVALGLATGLAAALVNPLILIGLAAGAAVAAWALRSPERALWLLVAVIALAPRMASPISIGFKPTLVDVALLLLLAAWALRAGRYPIAWRELPIALPLLALMAAAVATFIFGLPNGPFTTLVARRFAEMLLSLASVFVVAAVLREPAAQRRAATAMVVFGAASAAIGIALYVMPDDLAIRLLSALRPFDYPTGPEVLRYIRDDPALLQRATGTWIDPNAYGGFLLVAGAFALPQVFAAKPSLPRWLAAACAAAIGLALVLTASRGALLGLLAVALLVGGLRYRLVFLAAAIGVALILVLPQTRDLATHFADGFMGRDLATQMRLGEYKDALRLIERYPWLGVGFADTPDVDLYIGVSMMYLLIAQQMGLLGLLAFLAVIGALALAAARAFRRAADDAEGLPVWLGAQAAVAGVLISGIFDHYFMNIDFHNAVMLFCLAIGMAAATSRSALREAHGFAG
jgi:O-antigen ligase